jgi:hypothetical protein
MNTPLEAWLEKIRDERSAISLYESKDQAIAVIEKLKEALESFECKCLYKPFSHQYKFTCKSCEALDIDPEKL